MRGEGDDGHAEAPKRRQQEREQGAQAIRCLLQTFPMGYVEESPRGRSLWLIIDMPNCSGTDWEEREEWKKGFNGWIDQIQTWLKAKLGEWGCTFGGEVQGKFSLYDEADGIIEMTLRPPAIRAPRCPDDADVERFIAAHIDFDTVNQIIWRVPAPAPAPEPQPAAVVLAAVTSVPRVKGSRTPWDALPPIEDTGSVFMNRQRASSRAVRHVLGVEYDPSSVTEEQMIQIATIANDIYKHSKLSHRSNDSKRVKRLVPIVRYLIRTHEAYTGQHGTGDFEGGGLWWTLEHDLPRAIQLAKRGIPQQVLDQRSDLFAKRLEGIRITHDDIGLALCMGGKNHMTSGSVPAESIRGTFRYFKVRTNKAHVSQVMHLIDEFKLMPMTRNYSAGWRGRDYTPSDEVMQLPFLRHLVIELKPQPAPQKPWWALGREQHEQRMEQERQEQWASFMQQATNYFGGGANTHTTTSFIDKQSQYVVSFSRQTFDFSDSSPIRAFESEAEFIERMKNLPELPL